VKNLINGKKIALKISKDLCSSIKGLELAPALSVVSVGQNLVGQSFVEAKKKFGKKIGVKVSVHEFDAGIDPEVLRLSILKIINHFDGVVIQLPLPKEFDERKILNLIPIDKDPDVLNSFSRERFEKCKEQVLPPVAGALFEIFKEHKVAYKGKRVVVLGKGTLVGHPVWTWFRCQGVLAKSLDKENSEFEIREAVIKADILVSGIGIPGFVTPDMIKEGAVLIDAGTSGRSGEFRGDIDPLCFNKASLFTPVPGGVGPITIARLFII